MNIKDIELVLKDKELDILKKFVEWHNENYKDFYIPNSRIGLFLFTEKEDAN